MSDGHRKSPRAMVEAAFNQWVQEDHLPGRVEYDAFTKRDAKRLIALMVEAIKEASK